MGKTIKLIPAIAILAIISLLPFAAFAEQDTNTPDATATDFNLNHQAEESPGSQADSNSAIWEMPLATKTFRISPEQAKDLNSIIQGILEGREPEEMGLTAAGQDMPTIQIMGGCGQGTGTDITPMVTGIQNLKTCYDWERRGPYCEDWYCPQTNKIGWWEDLDIEYWAPGLIHGNSNDYNFVTIVTFTLPDGSVTKGLHSGAGQWGWKATALCFSVNITPMNVLGRWDIEVEVIDNVDSTEVVASTFVDVVNCPDTCQGETWQYEGFLDYDIDACNYKALDCNSQNSSGEWEYYCSGLERRKHRMASDYDCTPSGCELGNRDYSDDQLVERCSFNCQEGGCVNGCSGTLTIKAEDFWGEPVENAEVKIDGITEGTTNAGGELVLPTFSNSCGQIYTIEAKQGEASCGTKTAIISHFNKNSTVMFSCYQQQSGINSLFLTVSTDKEEYLPGEDIFFELFVNDFLYKAIENIFVNIKNPDESTTGVLTNNEGKAQYLAMAGTAERQRFLFAINQPGWNGTRQEHDVFLKYGNPSLIDTDNDGWSDAEEKLIGTRPDDGTSNMFTLIGEHKIKGDCFSPISWILGNTTKEEAEQVAESLKRMDAKELELLANAGSKSEILGMAAFENRGISESEVERKILSFESMLEEADELHYFSKENAVYFVFYDEETNATTLTVALSNCAGLIIGMAYGVGTGLRDDMGFAYQVMQGIYFYSLNADKILPALSATGEFLPKLPGMILEAVGGAGDLLRGVTLSILKQADQINRADPETERDEYAAFQIGYLEGFTIGYLAEQLFLIKIELDKVIDAFKGIKQTSRILDKASDALAQIAKQFGPETSGALSKLRHLNFVDDILRNGSKASQNGLGRISTALGNKADDLQAFFKGMTPKAAEEMAEGAERLYLRLSDDLAQLSNSLLLKKSRAWKTILANYADDVQEAVLKALKRGTINDSDEMLQGMAKYSSGSKKAYGITDPTDLTKFTAENQKHQLKYLYKSPKTTTKIGGETVNGTASLQKGIKETWGYDHIFEYIRPNDTTTRARQIQEAFKLADDQQAVLDLINEALEKGTRDPIQANIINYAKNQKVLKAVTGNSSDKIGTIITISFG